MDSQASIVIAGICSPELYKCQTCARLLKEEHPDRVVDYQMISLFPAQWDQYLKKLQNEKKGDFYQHKGNLVVYLANNDRYLGDSENFLEWALQEFRYVDNTANFIYKKMANDAYKNTIDKTVGRSYV